MADDESPLGGPLELPGGEQRTTKRSTAKSGRTRPFIKKILLVVGVVVIVAGIGFVASKLLTRKKSPPQSDSGNSQSSQQAATTSQTKVSDVPTVSGTKSFKSTSLSIELAYPVGWTATEANDGVRIESPEFGYKTATGTIVTGNFRVYIRKGAREVDSKYIGRGVAVMASEPLTYAAPTSAQRKQTNLSLFGLDTPDQFAFFLVAGNFNLKKGDTLGPNYGKEPDTILVAGGYSAKSLTDDFATNQVPLDSFQQTNAYKQALDIVKSLKLN